MRIKTTKTKNTIQYTIIKDINKNGKRTTCVYENLGTIDKIKIRAKNKDPFEWLKEYVRQIKNPYMFLCNGVVVKIAFADSRATIEDKLEQYIRHRQKN